MFELVLFFLFLITVFSIGRRLLSFFKAEFSKLEEFLLSVALGAGFLMYFTLLLSLSHLLYKEVYIALATVVFVLFFRDVRYLWKLSSVMWRHIVDNVRPNIVGVLLVAYIFFIIINAFMAFAPIFEFDSTTYHLAFAKTYATEHRFVYQPSQIYSVMPQGMIMLYSISELFSAPNLSPLIAYSFGVFASLAIYAFARKYSSVLAALMAVLLFFTSPVVIERLSQPMVDISLAYFFLVAVIVFFRYLHETDASRRASLVVLFSILAGLSVTVKIVAAFAAGSLLAAMVLGWLLFKGRFSAVHIGRHGVLYCLIVLLLISPWLILGYAYTGNPVYPQAYSIFDGKYLDSSLSWSYSVYHELVGLPRNIFNTLLVLWNITFKSKPFGATIGITPFFIIILPLVIFFYKGIKELREWGIIVAVALAILMIQFWVHPALRYMFPALALLSIAAAMLVDVLIKEKALRLAIVSLLLISLVFNAAIWYGINAKNIAYFFSGEGKGEYYDKLKDHNSYGAASWINANTTADSVVLLFNEPRGYFLDRKYVISSPQQTYIDYNSMNSTTDLLKRLNELGVSYILINDDYFDTYSQSAKGSKYVNELLRGFVKGHAVLVYEKGRIMVYKLER